MAGEMRYLRINTGHRDNVRQTIPPPSIMLVRPSGTTVEVPLSVADLIAVIRDASQALERLYVGRNATVPAGETTPWGCGRARP